MGVPIDRPTPAAFLLHSKSLSLPATSSTSLQCIHFWINSQSKYYGALGWKGSKFKAKMEAYLPFGAFWSLKRVCMYSGVCVFGGCKVFLVRVERRNDV